MAVEFIVVAFHPLRRTIGLFAWSPNREEAEAKALEATRLVKDYVGFTVCGSSDDLEQFKARWQPR